MIFLTARPVSSLAAQGHTNYKQFTIFTIGTFLFLTSIFYQGAVDASFVTLRSGRVELRSAESFNLSKTYTSISRKTIDRGGGVSSSSGSGSLRNDGLQGDWASVALKVASEAAPSAVKAAEDSTAIQKLYLVKYTEGYGDLRTTSLRSDLESGGGRILSYIPDTTLLVFATLQLVMDVSLRYKALMAPYEYDSKLSPEARSTIQAASPARQRRRRQLLQLSKSKLRGARHLHQHCHRSRRATMNRVLDIHEGCPNDDKPSADIKAGTEALGAMLRSLRTRAPRRVINRPTGQPPSGDTTRIPSGTNCSHQSQPKRGASSRYSKINSEAEGAKTDPQDVSLGQWRLRALRLQPSGGINNNTATATTDTIASDGASYPSPATQVESPPLPSESTATAAAAAPAPAGGGAVNTTDDLDLYGIEVHLVTGLPYNVLEDALRQWPGALAQALGRTEPWDTCWPQIDGSGLNGTHSVWVHVYLCAEDIQDGIDWLSKQQMATWIVPALQVAIQNDAAGWTIQTGNLSRDRFNNPTASLRPYWAAGIQGEDIIIGVGDTGVDLTHCFFLDERYDVDELRGALQGTPLSWTLDHRKVAQYVVTDSEDYFGDAGGGHGTHVAGSVAGSVAVGSSMFDDTASSTGSAPLARLSIVDMSPPNSTNLNIPVPYDTNYLPLHYRVGAKISSDSWVSVGSSAVVYDSGAQSFDAFAWRNPDFISVLVASNNGYSGLMPTICTPATAKNVITVGATVNHPKDVTSFGDQYAFVLQFRDASGTIQTSMVSVRQGSGINSWYSTLNNRVLPLVLSEPRGACGTLRENAYAHSVVVVDLGDSTCSSVVRVANVLSSGATAAIFIRPDQGFVGEDLAEPIPEHVITFTTITKVHGQWLMDVLTNPSNSRFVITFWYYPQVNVGIDSVASFSSYGPLPDGRIKPDIVAPGSLIRSASASPSSKKGVTRDTCSDATQYLSGTSMAAPLTSGHLALMRQYFRDGFYPQGDKHSTESAGFEPSGLLLKAAAIVGATSLRGGLALQSGATLGAPPDGYQGWGRFSLAGALPLSGLTGSNFRIQVADMGTIDNGETVHLKGLRATGTGPIRAALVWNDFPSALQATTSLVNDLDLKFSVNGGALRTTREDHVNNVERVEIRGLRTGDEVAFTVLGTRVVHTLLSGADTQLPQHWALAVVGDFEGVLMTQLNPSYVRPQRLPMFTMGTVVTAVDATITLDTGMCLAVEGSSIFASESCSVPYTFEFLEEKDAASSGYLYSARVGTDACLTFDVLSGISIMPCFEGSHAQRLALFKLPYTDKELFQIVPKPYLGVGSFDRLCLGLELSPPPQGSDEDISPYETATPPLGLLPCNADDPGQAFLLQPAMIAHSETSPTPSTPPQMPMQQPQSPPSQGAGLPLQPVEWPQPFQPTQPLQRTLPSPSPSLSARPSLSLPSASPTVPQPLSPASLISSSPSTSPSLPRLPPFPYSHIPSSPENSSSPSLNLHIQLPSPLYRPSLDAHVSPQPHQPASLRWSPSPVINPAVPRVGDPRSSWPSQRSPWPPNNPPRVLRLPSKLEMYQPLPSPPPHPSTPPTYSDVSDLANQHIANQGLHRDYSYTEPAGLSSPAGVSMQPHHLDTEVNTSINNSTHNVSDRSTRSGNSLIEGDAVLIQMQQLKQHQQPMEKQGSTSAKSNRVSPGSLSPVVIVGIVVGSIIGILAIATLISLLSVRLVRLRQYMRVTAATA